MGNGLEKKIKRKKVKADLADPVQPTSDPENQDGAIKAKLTIIKKKDKKKKSKNQDPIKPQDTPITKPLEEGPAKKTKKRKEEAKQEDLDTLENGNTEKVSEAPIKEKKKRKRDQAEQSDLNSGVNLATEGKVKKQKKIKTPSEEQKQAELEVSQGKISPVSPVKEKKEKKKKEKSKKEKQAENKSKPASEMIQNDDKAGGKPSEIQEKKKTKKAKKQDSAKTAVETSQADNGKMSEAPEQTQIAEENSTKKKKKKKSKKTLESEQAEQQANLPLTDKGIENEVQEALVQSAEEIGKEEAKLEAEIAENEGNPNLISPATTREGTAAKAFQRVKAEEWINKRAAKDNSYKGTFGSSGWGAKAQEVLGKVRGKDFRHEKTKKKRGSYRGGIIDSNVNSFKFESDEE